MITESNVLGEDLHLHLQFSILAKLEEHYQICFDTAGFIKNVRGKLGHDEINTFKCILRLNEKVGMDKEEFEKYLFFNIIPVYLDA